MLNNKKDKLEWREQENKIKKSIICAIILVILLVLIIIFFVKEIWVLITEFAMLVGLFVDLLSLYKMIKGG